ncbi:MAG TPA: Hsp70 family protein [Acidobacteriota bacterium]|nr:Hsp70 family protein [Acidobacteriota bacterium]
MKPVYGIDFGTTNCAVVEYNPGRAYHQFVKLGDYDTHPIPSLVSIDKLTQKVECGREIWSEKLERQETGQYLIVSSVKTALDTDEVWRTPKRSWTAVEIASQLFRFLCHHSAGQKTKRIDQAVVTIPVGMSAGKRSAIRQAAKTAGLEILTFLSEPTAAFIAHAQNLAKYRYVVVFDWGGGTLDICVLQIQSGQVSELSATRWDFAGDHIDRKLAEWIHLECSRQLGVQREFDTLDVLEKQTLLNTAEAKKRDLQEAEEVTFQIPYGGKFPKVKLTQKTFESLIQPVVTEAVSLLFRCVEKAKIAPEEVGQLIVVGGSSKLELLRQELEERWEFANVIYPPDAEWDIAKGAALIAANPGMYRTAESIGLILSDSEYHPLLPAGTTIEESCFQIQFGLVEDSTTANFVFANRTQNSLRPGQIGNLSLPTLGFRDEILQMDTKINEDLVFEAIITNQAMRQHQKTFQYDRLKWVYQLPEIQENYE